WATRLGWEPRRVIVKAQRRRWGSCARDGTVRLNWRLVMAEPALIDYVIVHELAHLAEPNHGPAFWARVRSALPDCDRLRRRLRDDGARFEL
ncbi:MAG: M48 family metallopeptidase, partial [Chloroflexi bacterium]|nr:M48 family metallopeptidase [Chloroflexota bacterium]